MRAGVGVRSVAFVGVPVGWGDALAEGDGVIVHVAVLVETIRVVGASFASSVADGDGLAHALVKQLKMRASVNSQRCFFMGEVFVTKTALTLAPYRSSIRHNVD